MEERSLMWGVEDVGEWLRDEIALMKKFRSFSPAERRTINAVLEYLLVKLEVERQSAAVESS